ncbi:hypothetical protein LCGC14_1164750 [marine sediment metagenome]|uniref:Uncharacterized protein n=1 Tax=marine sediment metagenome TaxID=412755 RepID=A0A0F9P9W1_9ZZZZ
MEWQITLIFGFFIGWFGRFLADYIFCKVNERGTD